MSEQPTPDQVRIVCRLVGCDPDKFPCCKRCGTDLYAPEFIQSGWLEPYFWLRHRLWYWRRSCPWLPKHCAVCHKRYFRGPAIVSHYVCSEECYEDWIPF